MAKKKIESDLFQRAPALRARHPAAEREMRLEADSAGAEHLLHALVAAAAIIAHADGRLELAERRRLNNAFLASPASEGFSVADVAEELAEHMRAYGYDPHAAEARALSAIKTLTLNAGDRRIVRDTCQAVISADGLVHPAELGALHRIEIVLGLGETGR